MAMAHDERADLADFLETLSPQQWQEPSLCLGWTVRDVVAHMISYEEHSTPDLLKRVVRTRFRRGTSTKLRSPTTPTSNLPHCSSSCVPTSIRVAPPHDSAGASDSSTL